MTVLESNLLPMKRLTEEKVLAGSLASLRRASWPTRTVPSAANDTTEGIVRLPLASATMTGLPSTTIATALLVVPRSMPQMDAARVVTRSALPRRLDGWGALRRSSGAVSGARARGVCARRAATTPTTRTRTRPRRSGRRARTASRGDPSFPGAGSTTGKSVLPRRARVVTLPLAGR